MINFPNQDFAARRALFSELKQAARVITLPLYKNGMIITNKAASGYDPVTQADMDAERVLRRHIQAMFPDDHIVGEEYNDVVGRNDWTWTLDPIDGTRAFIASVPVWSTLIALSYKNTPILGLIDHPAMGFCFEGGPGGAVRETDEGERLILSSRKRRDLSEAVLGCTEPLAMLNAGELAAYNVIRRGVGFSRLGLDAYGYALVASGKMDIIIESDLKPCDVRALMPVIEGAGGKMTNWHGGSCVDGGQVVAVGDPNLLPELYTYLGRAMTP